MLQEVVKIMGSDGLFQAAAKFGMSVPGSWRKKLRGRERIPWSDFVNSSNRHLVSPEAFDLLSGLLEYDHEKRLTVVEAMQHAYFDPVRGDAERADASRAGKARAAAATTAAQDSSSVDA